MSTVVPGSPEELALVLADAAAHSRTVTVSGNNSKRLMAGPVADADILLSTAGLRRILQYERDDLTISVEAGIPARELQAHLLTNGQMIALDPPFASQATVGGIVASNASGPLRHRFGTARDLVIGMTFATLEGKLVKTGGMVVKNVAGLDIGKLMIGSFGTLAVMTRINFRVHSVYPELQTFLFSFSDLDSAIEKRNEIARSVLQPIAIDLLTPPAAARIGSRRYMLLVRAGGTRKVLERYTHELQKCEQLTGPAEEALWQTIREFTPEFLRRQPGGVVLRISTTLTDMPALLKIVSDPCITRAGAGVTYVYLTSWQGVAALWSIAKTRKWSVVVEFAPDELRNTKELWLEPQCKTSAETFAIMKKVKQLFDPQELLNSARLYGRL